MAEWLVAVLRCLILNENPSRVHDTVLILLNFHSNNVCQFDNIRQR